MFINSADQVPSLEKVPKSLGPTSGFYQMPEKKQKKRERKEKSRKKDLQLTFQRGPCGPCHRKGSLAPLDSSTAETRANPAGFCKLL